MISKPEVLEETFAPNELVHRSGEITYLSSILEPIPNERPVEEAFIYGPSGTGKICTSQFLVDCLEYVVGEPAREEEETSTDPSVETHHIDCWGSSYSGMVRNVLTGYDDSVIVHQNTPTDDLSQMLADVITDPYIVVLDEVDQLDSDLTLFEPHEYPTEITVPNFRKRQPERLS